MSEEIINTIATELHKEDMEMLGKSLANDMVEPTFSIIEIISPNLIIFVIGLLIANYIYQNYIIKSILVFASSTAEERAAFKQISTEVRSMKEQIGKLSGPHQFAEQSLLKRKLLKLEPYCAKLAPKIQNPEKSQTRLYNLLATTLPYTVFIAVIILNRNVSLFRFTGSPETATGCISSIINFIGYPFMNQSNLTFSSAIGETFSNCTPLKLLSSGTAGIILWTIVISRALEYIKSFYTFLTAKK